ncbi:Phosphomevalonate kinase [Atractiella rhizophila]|nr:Phosphomevalonate kinase [Atractiella rhizophila]
MATISCPGKVFFAGGYLVLDREYEGFILSTSSRFYSHLRHDPDSPPGTITIKSPQFLQAEWTFKVVFDGSKQHVKIVDGSVNHDDFRTKGFIGLALSESVKLSVAMYGKEKTEGNLRTALEIFVVGDNEFYTQPVRFVPMFSDMSANLSSMQPSATPIPPFNRLNVTLNDVHKTGLGSSAAMVSSLVGVLCVHFGLVETASVEEKKIIIHNLSQYVHSLAQGKLGSGFDVSTAIWGSQVYRKFDQGCLAGLMEAEGEIDPEDLYLTIMPSKNLAWLAKDTAPEVQPFNLPKGLTLLLADVDGGSNTPSMVGKVLAWRSKNEKQAHELWQEISKGNSRLATLFGSLNQSHEVHPTLCDSAFGNLADKQLNAQIATKSTVEETLLDVARVIKSIRSGMRKMGELAGVPIEPPEQQKLIDACCELPGVLGGGVPGAGGYDAIWILIIASEETEKKVSSFFEGWKENQTKVKLLSKIPGSMEAREGLKELSLGNVPGLKELINGQ